MPNRVLRTIDMPVIGHRSATFGERSALSPSVTGREHRVRGQADAVLGAAIDHPVRKIVAIFVNRRLEADRR